MGNIYTQGIRGPKTQPSPAFPHLFSGLLPPPTRMSPPPRPKLGLLLLPCSPTPSLKQEVYVHWFLWSGQGSGDDGRGCFRDGAVLLRSCGEPTWGLGSVGVQVGRGGRPRRGMGRLAWAVFLTPESHGSVCVQPLPSSTAH